MLGFAYYFFPEDEKERALELKGLVRSYHTDLIELSEGQMIPLESISVPNTFQIRSQSLVCLGLVCPVQTTSDLPDLVKGWEEMVGSLADIFLLGRTYAAVGEGVSRELLATLQSELDCDPTKDYPQLIYGSLPVVRQGWGWDDGLALCAIPTANAELLFDKFPRVEMKWLRTQLFWHLSRDQRDTIGSERDDLERQLSGILFSTLVPASRNEQLEAIERDMNTLSQGYGVLATNHRLLSTGMKRLSKTLNTFEKEIREGELCLDLPSRELVLAPIMEELSICDNLVIELRDVRQDYKAGMEVVGGKIEMLLSHENLNLQQRVMDVMELGNAMQRQSLTLQVAASLVEFIIVAYYGLNLWKNLDPTGFGIIPEWGRLALVTLFAGDAVYLTHIASELIQGHKELKKKLTVSVVVAFLVMIVIIGARFI
ncbi:MAG: hypothetical protein GX825_02210 [Syntrophomonadaceae bacterium]|nr:hypothetical protein [Syntrophomonadaceae bacterium]